MQDRDGFRAELAGWTLRGSLCALNSFSWAWMTGFKHPAEIAGMLIGVVFWVAVFALFTANLPKAAQVGWQRFGAALKIAAWIKFSMSLLGQPVLAGWLLTTFAPLGVLFAIDMWLGVAALWLTGKVGGFADFVQISSLDSIIWTMLTTIFQGALMAVVLSGIAMLVRVWRTLTSSDVEPANAFPPDQGREVVQPPGPACP